MGGAAAETAKVLINPVEIWQGESVLVRYPKGSVMWEIDARLNTGKGVVRTSFSRPA